MKQADGSGTLLFLATARASVADLCWITNGFAKTAVLTPVKTTKYCWGWVCAGAGQRAETTKQNVFKLQQEAPITNTLLQNRRPVTFRVLGRPSRDYQSFQRLQTEITEDSLCCGWHISLSIQTPLYKRSFHIQTHDNMISLYVRQMWKYVKTWHQDVMRLYKCDTWNTTLLTIVCYNVRLIWFLGSILEMNESDYSY